MKLLVIIVQDDDINKLIKELNNIKVGVTRLASTGGFLKKGNTTILVGAQKARVEEIKGVLKKTCNSRVELMPSIPVVSHGVLTSSDPIEVRVGGAIMFQLDIEEFNKY